MGEKIDQNPEGEQVPYGAGKTFEPPEKPVDKAKTGARASVFAHWLRIVDNVRTIIQRQNEYIYIPDLRK